ncbi:DUF2520 domain-containing protein [Hyphococcus sp.]|uniref:DUF2520 domain-containing protein n=1 Tax=Hyphococcus sp. TaxID=2038636 RepID=UPI003CCB8007
MTAYTIFGCGRVGLNIAHYLEAYGHTVDLISRRDLEAGRAACIERVQRADVIAAAIPDDQLSVWRDAWRCEFRESQIVIHFSGAVSVAGAHSVHPLYSFPQSTLPIARMKEIAFACSPSAPAFETVFPGLPNRNFIIKESDRARYHALAVLAGNLPAFIWNNALKELSSLADTPAEDIIESYLTSIIERFAENPTGSMTGPVARRDRTTVTRNLQGLEGAGDLKRLYEAFLDAAWPDFDASGD